MNIYTKTIPHSEQRYETSGDWWFDQNDDLQIRVSDMGNPEYEFLIARHEADEAMICKYRNIPEEKVMDFDIQFERERAEGKHALDAEPGMQSNAPYYDPHLIATSLERLLAPFLGVDWEEYSEVVNELP